MDTPVPDVPAPLPDGDEVVDRAVARASAWIAAAAGSRSRRERANRRRLSRLLRDPAGLPVTMALTDQVMRIPDPGRAAGTLREAAAHSRVRALGVRDHVGLAVLGQVSAVAPEPAMRLVHWQVRQASQGIILPAEERPLRAHLQRRSREGARLNINVLGEAVLGEAEASRRLDRVVEMVGRPEVSYVSVKISAIAAQLSSYDHAGSVRRVAERLRRLYRAARATEPETFVNLDMEEYRDLDLTVDCFQLVLDEPEFRTMSAGIVLQAYLPESHAMLQRLLAWARQRLRDGGAPIKVRLVKGANLAMESAEAQVHGWVAAPYPTKADVDASWKRLADAALRPGNAHAVRVGLASHNLFDLAWAWELALHRGVTGQVDVEMLEGMANAEALVVGHDVGSVLLYAPVTRADDFASAVAYLVRRLDENTAPENYLRASFDMAVGSPAFTAQEERFRAAVAARHTVATDSRRRGPVPAQPAHPVAEGRFVNQADIDVTRPEQRAAISAALGRIAAAQPPPLPLVIGGTERTGAGLEDGHDPSDDGATWYRYHVAGADHVDEAVAVAHAALAGWEARGPQARAELLWAAAQVMAAAAHETLATMCRDTGKTIAEGIPEVSEAVDFARFYARSALVTLGPGATSRPAGVVVVVPPWNFPYAIPAGGVLAALAAGCTVILKPAPEAVATAHLLAGQLWRAGIPRDVLQLVATRDDDVGRRLVTHERVGAVVLTGSWQTARLFTSWRPGLRLLAETSGKNALLISATADIDAAVRDLVHSAFGHAGQKCSAASLAIVEAGVHDDPAFARQLADAVTSLVVGRAEDPATVVGPVVRPPEGPLRRALTQLDPGESWLVEPRQLDRSGHLWSPGVRMGVAPGSWAHRTEWFGPVLAVLRAPDLATALAWQNGVDYGLTAGLHALDVADCQAWIDGVQAGNVYVNRGTTGAVVNRQPFGGWKRSAVGPTAKAGGESYVSCLRDWDPAPDGLSQAAVERWWARVGGVARDLAGLAVERNLVRLRPLPRPILVRVDADVADQVLESVRRLSARTGTRVRLSCADPGRPGVVSEPLAQVRALLGSGQLSRIRWLSRESPEDLALAAIDAGVALDRRPLAAWVDVEGPRWMAEQSVCVTAHRYGNVGAGPQPLVPGGR